MAVTVRVRAKPSSVPASPRPALPGPALDPPDASQVRAAMGRGSRANAPRGAAAPVARPHRPLAARLPHAAIA